MQKYQKYLNAIAAPCCTFGPLFMTVSGRQEVGAFMLALGLLILFRTIVYQGREIARLREVLGQSK
ncbi:MAG: hypothetical protein NTU53_10470 [Planctomycetota bacterium]|nr:hypothetical protein [Planctomycetota bacterium]